MDAGCPGAVWGGTAKENVAPTYESILMCSQHCAPWGAVGNYASTIYRGAKCSIQDRNLQKKKPLQISARALIFDGSRSAGHYEPHLSSWRGR